MRYLGIIGLALAVATPAMASDDNGYAAIATGDFGKAAKQLEAANRMFPGTPETMLNLAAVYLKTGRVADARMLYVGVMQQPEAKMEMPSGETLSSYTVASRGLARTEQKTFALR